MYNPLKDLYLREKLIWLFDNNQGLRTGRTTLLTHVYVDIAIRNINTKIYPFDHHSHLMIKLHHLVDKCVIVANGRIRELNDDPSKFVVHRSHDWFMIKFVTDTAKREWETPE